MNRLKAELGCIAAGVSFEKAFRWQYLLTQKEIKAPALSRHEFSSWYIYTGSGLNVAQLEDKKGCPIGIFLGVGVDQTGLIVDRYRIDTLDLDKESFFDDFEKWLFHVAGRYNVLISREEISRFYSDPAGTNGMVYDRNGRQVASSLALCLDRPVEDHPLYDHTIVERGEGNYSLFHTRDAHALRGNPNFHLDLGSFSETRFWPQNEGFESGAVSLQQIYGEMISTTQHVIRKINGRFKTALPLSGGQDSRLLASMAGAEIHEIDQIFTNIHNYSSRIDATIAGKIAEVLSLDHEVFDRRKIDVSAENVARDEKEFHVALGMRIPLKREVIYGLQDKLADGAIVLRGHQTDLLRAVFIDRLGGKARKNLRWQIKRMMIVSRKEFSQETYERFLPAYQAWIDTLPVKSRTRQVDLMFLEIYYSATIGAFFPAMTRNFYMSPFNSRRMMQLSLSIDEKYRHNSFAVNDILLITNPDLHDVPFDYEFGGNRGLELIDNRELMAELTAKRRQASHDRLDDLVRDPVERTS